MKKRSDCAACEIYISLITEHPESLGKFSAYISDKVPAMRGAVQTIRDTFEPAFKCLHASDHLMVELGWRCGCHISVGFIVRHDGTPGISHIVKRQHAFTLGCPYPEHFDHLTTHTVFCRLQSSNHHEAVTEDINAWVVSGVKGYLHPAWVYPIHYSGSLSITPLDDLFGAAARHNCEPGVN